VQLPLLFHSRALLLENSTKYEVIPQTFLRTLSRSRRLSSPSRRIESTGCADLTTLSHSPNQRCRACGPRHLLPRLPRPRHYCSGARGPGHKTHLHSSPTAAACLFLHTLSTSHTISPFPSSLPRTLINMAPRVIVVGGGCKLHSTKHPTQLIADHRQQCPA
jgi:hypothetical protein